MKTRFRLELNTAVNADSPDILIGIIGDGSTETLGDFVGFIINKDTGKWKGIAMVNAVVAESVETIVDVDANWTVCDIQLFSDKSAVLQINSEDAFTFPAGTCNFANEDNCGIYIINNVAEDNNIIIDYINTSRDRSTEIPT
jgi:hypothetical protein